MRISKSHVLFFILGLFVAGLCSVVMYPTKPQPSDQMTVSIEDDEFTLDMNHMLLQEIVNERNSNPCKFASVGLKGVKRIYVNFSHKLNDNKFNDLIQREKFENAFEQKFNEYDVIFAKTSEDKPYLKDSDTYLTVYVDLQTFNKDFQMTRNPLLEDIRLLQVTFKYKRSDHKHYKFTRPRLISVANHDKIFEGLKNAASAFYGYTQPININCI
ncbi:MAG: hypothetical protein ACTHOO_08705 [Alcanivorax sp.]